MAKHSKNAVKFKDVLRIVHPSAKDANQAEVFRKIMADELATPYTWETELSANGSKPAAERKSKKELWTELVTSGKVGYMALLRNLRNIHEADLDSSVLKTYVLDVISDEKRVLTSKQLPYDFIEAYNVVRPLNHKMATAVSKAIDISVKNIPQLGEKVWFILDFSGSMGHDDAGGFGGGQTGTTSAITGGTMLAAFLLKANENADIAVTLFGSHAKTLNGVDTNNSALALKQELLRHRQGGIAGSTNFAAALREYSTLPFVPDTIVVITDGEVNGFPYSVLKTVSQNKRVMKLTVNMSVAQTTPMTQADGWYSVAGWSTSMFKWIPAMRDSVSVVEQLSGPYTGVPAKAKKTVDETVEQM